MKYCRKLHSMKLLAELAINIVYAATICSSYINYATILVTVM